MRRLGSRPVSGRRISASPIAAALAFAGLVVQMALPALHGLELRAVTEVAGTAPSPVVGVALERTNLNDAAARHHDRAECPVCQSLLRTGRAAPHVAAHVHPIASRVTAPGERPGAPRDGLLRGNHSPRAPPSTLPA